MKNYDHNEEENFNIFAQLYTSLFLVNFKLYIYGH